MPISSIGAGFDRHLRRMRLLYRRRRDALVAALGTHLPAVPGPAVWPQASTS